MSRRRLLQTAGAAATAAFAAEFLPPSIARALATGPSRGGRLSDIKHVVILMQENRSFDHYFGALPGVAWFRDPNAITLSTGKLVFYQPDPSNPDGYLLPFHYDTTSTNAQQTPGTSHSWPTQHRAWDNGAMDQWVAAKGPYTMGYFTGDDVPFHWALAQNFTICDHYHCSMLGPTWPNRLYLMSASVDADGVSGAPVVANGESLPYTWETYPEALTKTGVSWKVYQQSDNYGCNVLEYFKTFQDAPVSSELYRNGLRFYQEGQFEYDARHDRLPTVSWIIPTSYQSEHPDYTAAAGADFAASKIEAIAANPDVWAKTVFILNYDENDGMFDHVIPPTAPAGTAGENITVNGVSAPIGAGFRVPCLIVSPWTQGGWVVSENFDHTSVLQFLEALTGVTIPNITAWRRQTFGNLLSAFGAPSWTPFPRLPDTKSALARAYQQVTTLPAPQIPGGDQALPFQQPGSRPRRHQRP
jgi:phospholipase C